MGFFSFFALSKVSLFQGNQSTGFEAFDTISVAKRERGESQGSFSVDITSNETGDKSLRLLVDLLVQALNPLKAGSSE